jgi:hypothetical protein
MVAAGELGRTIAPVGPYPRSRDACRARVNKETLLIALKSRLAGARIRVALLALAALPIILAACNNGGSGGNGY